VTGVSLLIDTHVAIWWWTEPDQISPAAMEAMTAGRESIFVSPVVAVEIAIKFRVGKLTVFGDPAADFPRLMAENRFQSLPITQAHALAAGLLPGAHRDPFDRIIAAQALAENMVVVTCDPEFAAFGCKVLW
jgi:PIN domain nuclease of toxin-antitoxin system